MSSTISVADAIGAGFKLLKTVIDTKQVRDMRKAIEAGEKYIMVNEGTSSYGKQSIDKKNKYLRHYKKRFFHFN